MRRKTLVDGVFSFQPTFDSGRYKSHCITTGCVTVLRNNNGERVVVEWKFQYDVKKRGKEGVLVRELGIPRGKLNGDTFLFPKK